MEMKKAHAILIVAIIGALVLSATPREVQAQIPVLEIIKQGVKKVIKAIDLMIQRMQNKTIWLQNAQKVLENKLSEFKLSEIAQWTEKQRTLYKEYYDELWQVRNTIATYQRIRQIMNRQVMIVGEYKRTWELVSQDKHFTSAEIDYMYRVYTGILDESLFNLEQILLVVNSFKTQMSDAKRLEIINQAGEGIEQNYADLKQFNQQNIQLSLSRAKDEHEIQTLKKLYGISN
jgi:hypothetical protein